MKKIILLLLVLLMPLFYLSSQFLGPGGPEEEKFVVPLYTTQSQIVDDLFAQGFCKNKTIFEWFLKRQGREIATGAYLISKNMNVYQLVQTLTAAPFQKWVIIPPAKRKEQVALLLQKALNWPENQTTDFIKIAQEGWLHADTYLIESKADAQKAYEKLFNTFNEKLNEENLPQILLNKNIRLDTAIKFASLIEREYGSEEDRALIAGIIWNRLDQEMKLEIDATVQYALASQECDFDHSLNTCNFWPALTGAMIRKTDSAYNTYQEKGLPPGPICSPSMASLQAVANPAETKALYYLHSKDSQIHTAETYQEHLKNIEKFLN